MRRDSTGVGEREWPVVTTGMLGTPASPAALDLTPGVAPDAMSWDTRAGRDVGEAQAYVLVRWPDPER